MNLNKTIITLFQFILKRLKILIGTISEIIYNTDIKKTKLTHLEIYNENTLHAAEIFCRTRSRLFSTLTDAGSSVEELSFVSVALTDVRDSEEETSFAPVDSKEDAIL